jgi:hypothetical protein
MEAVSSVAAQVAMEAIKRMVTAFSGPSIVPEMINDR